MKEIPKFANIEKMNEIFQEMAKKLNSNEIALIKNPEYIYTPFDAYVLAPKIETPLKSVKGIVCDMDGTTTTTETLCLYSQEWMVRKITDREDSTEWKGLDHEKDYPHIIGNSTTKHIEYLINTYSENIKENNLKETYVACSLWTILIGRDESRRKEALEALKVFGLGEIEKESEFMALDEIEVRTDKEVDVLAKAMFKKYENEFRITEFHDIVRASIEIYYYQYHSILVKLEEGKARQLGIDLFGDGDKKMIEPMPGIGIYLAMIKGWIGEECGFMYDALKKHLVDLYDEKYVEEKCISTEEFQSLGKYFENNPVQISIVTSSIYYEANIVLEEVFKVLGEEVREWNISVEKKELLMEKFSDYRNVYNAFITASDSSETRLKPHRDLYSIALHKMGFSPRDFDKIIGYEDSESGTIAIRAAGIGKCIAVPFQDTEGHNLEAATHTLKGGIVEALLEYNGFLDKEVVI